MPPLSPEPTHEQLNRVAGYFWQKRGAPLGNPDPDWAKARRFLDQDWVQKRRRAGYNLDLILWEDHMRLCTLRSFSVSRTYLAIEAEVDPDGLQRRLELQPGKIVTGAAVIVVLDGAPEFSRECFRRHANNCILPEQAMEGKDGRFFRHCCRFSSYGGTVLGPSAEAGRRRSRPFQDGCAMAFEEGPRALMAALHLRRELATINEEENLGWPDRFHVRVGIAPSWRGAVGALLCARRDEIVVDPVSWPSCDESCSPLLEELLTAAGVRAGPGVEDLSPSFDDLWATVGEGGK